MSFGSSDKVRTAIGRRSDPAPSFSSSLNASRRNWILLFPHTSAKTGPLDCLLLLCRKMINHFVTQRQKDLFSFEVTDAMTEHLFFWGAGF